MDNKLINFLKDLSLLTLKHNIIIGGCGCGCCESPWLYDIDYNIQLEGEHYADRLKWNEEKNKYYLG